MAVENYFLSREGQILSDKILKFMRSLIIKIDREANLEETKESYLSWLAYKYAYEGSDDIYAYDYDMSVFIAAGIPSSIVNGKNLLNKESCFKLCLNNDADALRLLYYLRNKRISTYVETNSYYSQFLGLPRPGQNIKIKNKDSTSPEFLKLEDITISEYPKTYEYIYVEGIVDTIKKDHPDYYYIRYLINKKSIYYVRNTEQFDIIDYDNTIFNENEISTFFDIYNKKKIYMQKMMYIDGFNTRMELYPFLMELLLLQDVFMSFFNSFMDNFALANYSDREIYDLLDSYDLSSLKQVKLSTLRKIIKDIPDLIELRGSDLIIEKILDIVADDSVTIKRYFLQKEYLVNASGETVYDTSKTYEKNVNLVFKEKIIRVGDSNTSKNINEYETFVRDDDLWGGELEGASQEEKDRIKAKFKNEILKMDFGKILTKYLTISSTINTHSKQIKLQNYLGLFWQFVRKTSSTNNFLAIDEISFESFSVKAIDIYAAICWFYQYLNGIDDPAVITIKNMNIEHVMALRDSGIGILEDITGNKLDITNPNYKPPATVRMPKEFSKRTIIDILGSHEDTNKNDNPNDIEWPYFKNYDGSKSINYESTLIASPGVITLDDLFKDYKKNSAIIDGLKRKWITTANLAEARAWEYLIEKNHTHTLFEVMFDNKSRYDKLIKESNSEFYNYLSLVIDDDNALINKYDAVYKLYMRLLDVFKAYIQEKTDNIIILPGSDNDDSESSMSYLTDLKLLFNEFLSIYTELHKIEYSQVMDDAPYNRIRLLYYYDTDVFYDSYHDKTYVDGKIKRDESHIIENIDLQKYERYEMIKKRIADLSTTKETIDILGDQTINDLEKSNMFSILNEAITQFEDILHNSIGGLTQENQNYYTLYKLIRDKIQTQSIITYNEIYLLDVNGIKGIEAFIFVNKKEIEYLKSELEKLQKRNDVLPKYRHYIKEYLLEYYIERIKLLYKVTDELFESKLTDKVYINDNIKFVIDILYDDIKERVELFHVLDLRDEHITSLIQDVLKIVKYNIVETEFHYFESFKVRYTSKLKEDIKYDTHKYKLQLLEKYIEHAI